MQEQIKNAVKRLFQATDDCLTEVTLTVKSDGEYDPDTGTIPATSTSYAVKCFLLSFKQHEIDNTLIKKNDRKLILETATCPVIPTVENQVIIDGMTYNIVNVQTRANVCLYLQIRA